MDPVCIYLVGTAGAGKSTLAYGMQQWMHRKGLDAINVNLDPGVNTLPYMPDVDVRDLVNLAEVMEEYDLGPNGAQIAAGDLVALKASEIKDVIDEFNTDYVIIDTPGQLELFTFRNSSTVLVNEISPRRGFHVFLFDPKLIIRPSGYVSTLLLSLSAQLRIMAPGFNLLSKCDLLDEEEKKRILSWSHDIGLLLNELEVEGGTMLNTLNISLLRSMSELDIFRELVPISITEMEGLEDLYNNIQQTFFGGEDLMPD